MNTSDCVCQVLFQDFVACKFFWLKDVLLYLSCAWCNKRAFVCIVRLISVVLSCWYCKFNFRAALLCLSYYLISVRLCCVISLNCWLARPNVMITNINTRWSILAIGEYLCDGVASSLMNQRWRRRLTELIVACGLDTPNIRLDCVVVVVYYAVCLCSCCAYWYAHPEWWDPWLRSIHTTLFVEWSKILQ